MKKIQEEMDEEKKKLMLQAAEAEAAARAAREAEEAEANALMAEEADAEAMADQLAQLEAKILHNDTLPDQTEAMRLDLQRKQAEMSERRMEEQRLAQAL